MGPESRDGAMRPRAPILEPVARAFELTRSRGGRYACRLLEGVVSQSREARFRTPRRRLVE